jgi:signal peptidase
MKGLNTGRSGSMERVIAQKNQFTVKFQKFRNSEKFYQVTQKILLWIGVALCVVSVPIILINASIAIQSQMNKDKVPEIFGVAPMVVLSNSMKAGEHPIQKGDMVFAKAQADYKKGDIILFKSGDSSMMSLHRIVSVQTENGKKVFTTKGVANNVSDMTPIKKNQVVGKMIYTVPSLGKKVLFFKTPTGMFTALGIPFVLLLLYDLFGRELRRKFRKREPKNESA